MACSPFSGGAFCGRKSSGAADSAGAADSLRYPGERHLRNIRQLTFEGENAEAYLSFDDRQLTMRLYTSDQELRIAQEMMLPISRLSTPH